MLELVGYLICGMIVGSASVLSGRMQLKQAAVMVAAGLVGILIVSLAPHLSAPQDEVRAAIAHQGTITLWFFLALLSACIYGAMQIIGSDLPDELTFAVRRLENAAIACGAVTLILGLAITKLALAGIA